jgi:hypothetical protein
VRCRVWGLWGDGLEGMDHGGGSWKLVDSGRRPARGLVWH